MDPASVLEKVASYQFHCMKSITYLTTTCLIEPVSTVVYKIYHLCRILKRQCFFSSAGDEHNSVLK